MTTALRPYDAFTPDGLASVIARSPAPCGSCPTCRAAGDRARRVAEYLANLWDWEVPSEAEAVGWLREAYPPCPID